MNAKKWLLVGAVVVVAVWFAWGFMSQRSPAKATGALPKPPATAYEITQGNWTFYANSYQTQGKTIVLSDFYALADGKWKRQTASTILSEKNGQINIRRVQP